MRIFLAMFFLGVSLQGAHALEYEVITTTEASLYANITLIKGEKGIVLVDAPFTRADAHRVVAAVLDTGLPLEKVVVTHDHPDHYFGMDVIADAFPNTKIIAHAAVVADIWRSTPAKLKRWNPVLGANRPRYAAIPEELEGNSFDFEGHRMEFIGPLQGDHERSTVLWIPDEKVLIAGDLTFNQVHLPLFEHYPPQRNEWIKSLDRLAKLGAKTVVAGHRRPDLDHDNDSIAWTRNYIVAFEKIVAQSKNSDEIIAAVQSLYPNTTDVIGGFLVTTSAKVAAGEEEPWHE